jgi:hypothetical protein
MNNFKLILTASLFGIIITGCQKEPTACFTVNTASSGYYSSIHVNVSTNFDCTCSKNAAWYELYIDGNDQVGGSSSGSNQLSLTKTGVFPLTFSITGSHTVKLMTYSKGKNSGKSNEISQTITVVP